ncbi:GlcG/HbpS family heme-binding protein [Riemerella anatipestifer]|uniref:GlcG/HbpS family heme-binding protein n=1 Tax=Riemerella anatipestifer TaxID=34085 RepID=UPI000D692759|nr:heme-binding protein [Riemerella anatipestifer]MBT0551446.1 heme-binding protein [Riemerella anatipestifer]MBT0553823.1 heme-binding protein [Riemerella anatipestifer]MCE3024205.1 heme-binding protein [Riemerella anatipestifer]MCU7542661.1 heme-binding protein [Riemerella anatipestifer]MCU7559848.1 heme-binding protein [Riemerella anatipestifer]
MKSVTLFFTLFLVFMKVNAQTKNLYEPVLTGDAAMKIAQKAFDEANKSGHHISITVVNQSGQTLAVLRHHNAGVHTLQASYKKAFTANSQKRETAEIAQGIKNGTIPEDVRYLDENILILDGGVPIYIDGKVVGGIGVGGAHGSEDVRIAKAGISAIEINTNQ